MEIKEFFEPVLSFIKGFQKKDKEPASKQAAKDRLKLVLMQDRASVSPDFFELMKQEIIDVIKKYIEIDEESLEVELARGFESGLEGPALYANIPIKNVKPVAPKSEESAALSEEEADKLADEILDNIEEAAGKSEKEEATKTDDDTTSNDEGGTKAEVEVAQKSDVEGEIAPNLIGVISPESEELIRRVLKEDQETSEDDKIEEVSSEVKEKAENEKVEDEKVEEATSTATTDEENVKPKKTSTKKSTSSKTSKTAKSTTRKKKSE